MSDDWKVGDLAVCVDAGPLLLDGCTHSGRGLVSGRTYRVAGTSCCRVTGKDTLVFTEETGLDGSLVLRFRKIRPDEPEACETEFVELLKLSKQRVCADLTRSSEVSR